MSSSKLIEKATFSPKIKIYILLAVGSIMFLTIVGIPLMIIWFCGLGQWLSKRYFEKLDCQLTTRHLEFKKGVFFRMEKTIPLENIQDLTFISNPILKALELRMLKIETAGQSNPRGSDMKLVGIRDADEFKTRVLKQREMLRTTGLEAHIQASPANEQTNELLREIRDLLDDIKNLNQTGNQSQNPKD